MSPPLRLQVISKGSPRRPRRITELFIYFSLLMVTEFQNARVCFVPGIVKCFLQLPKHSLYLSTLDLRDGYGSLFTLFYGQLTRYISIERLEHMELAPQRSRFWEYLLDGTCFSPTTVYHESAWTPSAYCVPSIDSVANDLKAVHKRFLALI